MPPAKRTSVCFFIELEDLTLKIYILENLTSNQAHPKQVYKVRQVTV